MKSGQNYLDHSSPDAAKIAWFHDFRSHFNASVLEPINRFVYSQEDILIGFILMSCAIDYLAGFWWGESTEGGLGRKAYTRFIDRYFIPRKRYNSQGIYDSLRNGLVHMFTIKKSLYELTFHEPENHLTVGKHGYIILNASNFRDDLFAAANRYFNEVEITPELLDKAFERYRRDGFIAWVD
ncbi:MAG: hypothetical protein ABSB79_05065 [Syntrophales bacterium]|jgi:hypothetical protein